jgi:preprotein translocase subunit YajC
MNFLTFVLQAAPAAGAQAQPQGGGWSMWIMLIAIFAIMWLFMIRPQRKQQKEMEQFRNALKKGDKVITAGGIYGTIAEVNERTVLLKVDGDVKLRIDKASLQKDPAAAPAAPAAPAETGNEKK